MAYSSILGADRAPAQPSGRSIDLLGPSDSTDTGSDSLFTPEATHGDSDATGTGERGAVPGDEALDGVDIMPDQVVRMDADSGMDEDDNIPGSGNGFQEADPDGQEFTDIDADADADAADGAADGDR